MNCPNNGYVSGNSGSAQGPIYAWMLERDKEQQQHPHFQQPITDTALVPQTGTFHFR